MNTILPVHSRSSIGRNIPRFMRYFRSLSSGLLLLASTAFGQTNNHSPTISWLPDQRSSNGMFSRQYFRIWDKESTLTAGSISIESTNPGFTNPIGITKGACGPDDFAQGCPEGGLGYYIDFPHAPGNSSDPSATVKVKVTDGILTATSSFTLRKDSAVNPPVIGGIPNEQIQQVSVGFQYGPVWFVVSDLDSSGQYDAANSEGVSQISWDMSSDNTDLVPVENIDIQQRNDRDGALVSR